MKSFADLGVFAAFLLAKAATLPLVEHEALKEGAELIRDDARHRIGNYQAAVGPFPAWAPLSEATLQGFHHVLGPNIPGKEELGYAPPDNPLLREGHLRDSIGVTVSGREAAIGSGEQIAVWQEMGTPNAIYPIPPRPFLGPAGFVKGEAAADAIGKAVTDALAGEFHHPASKPGR